MPDTWRLTVPRGATDDRESLIARLWGAGALGVWERPDDVVAWFEQREADVPDEGEWEREPDRDWQESWKEGLEPIRAGPFVVVPSWLAHEPASQSTGGDDEPIRIVLDPGRAFGTGHHATTAMCLEELATVDLEGRDVLDVGTGSGILAIAAARRGAARVAAVDTDPEAVEAARENAERAGVDLDLATGSVDSVPGGPFGLVLANLLTETLEELRLDLTQAVSPGGTLIVSGVSTDRRDALVASFAGAGLGPPAEIRERDGWVAVRWDRPVDARPPGP